MDTHNIKGVPNPGSSNFASQSQVETLHQCIESIKQTYSRWSDLLDESLDSPDIEWFTDGSSFIEMGI